ncbi:exo-rhamnogalacturonan lyase family protein [Konateibacter massiliensis]|uniref:exo-rhamnogalacturonan lyase family protein n=1 Tax=Konateibacter massiliensis TaxID=2002841 RepID=UPI001F38F592|nr:hypothetical protein [Konateibacter massiliensis]
MERTKLHFLENRRDHGYVNFGTLWEKGKVSPKYGFSLLADGKRQDIQTRITAYWPDGSVKWAAHSANIKKGAEDITVESKRGDESYTDSIQISENSEAIVVDTKKMSVVFSKKGEYLIDKIETEGKISAFHGKLIGILEERGKEGATIIKKEVPYRSKIHETVIEEQGRLKTVIKITGIHINEETGREVLPFIVRFTAYYGSEELHMTHTFLYDGKPEEDFLKGLGIQFACQMDGAMYNRHVKILGETGVFHEAMQLLLSWRPPVAKGLYEAQLSGEFLQLDRNTDRTTFEAIDDMTVWDSYRIIQDSANHYLVKKSTGKEDCCYISCLQGEQAKGVIHVAGENGGIALGMRNFWEKYPSSFWIDDIKKDVCQVTAWIWSPEAEAMDFRHYDDVGHASAYYEGFHEVGATPYGIANTNELVLKSFAGRVAGDEELSDLYEVVQKPAILVASPEEYHEKRAFGIWSLPSRETAVESWLEEQLDLAVEFYKNEVKTRKWYGLFNYGDFMHTYDKARHCWRYDMGGYAWQNTELVPTYWLWYAFLRSGREDIYSLAEAMTRHCSEVDVYHLGEYKGIGSRHNVVHWGCSCKEPRIAMAGHHRFFYYLTGDNRMEDIFDDVKDADFSSLNIDPLRFFYDKDKMVYPTHARSGPDWSSYVANWITQWERKQDESYKNKILVGMEDLKQAPLQLTSGSDYEYDPESGHLRYIGEYATGGSHLALCMGAAQIWTELADMIEDDEWRKMIADFGVFYFDTPEEKRRKSKDTIGDREFDHGYMAASMAAYGANYYKDSKLADKVWRSLFDIMLSIGDRDGFAPKQGQEYVYTKGLNEIPWISTNFTSQWCLNVIVALELIKNDLAESLEGYEKE